VRYRIAIYLVAAAAIGSAAPPQTAGQSSTPSKHVAKILSRGDGTSEETAYKVGSVHDEYEVLSALGLTSEQQSLVIKKKPYDVLRAKDPKTGAVRDIWFDISSFYPEFQF